jgi:uncharacterized protein (DUF1800 family)
MAMAGKAEIIAANRFGMGRTPVEARAYSGDPRGWLADQVLGADWPEELLAAPTLAEIYGQVAQSRMAARESEEARTVSKKLLGDAIRFEAELKLRTAVLSRTSFAERWVWFWGNHFTVSRRALVDKVIGALAGAFERESIRRHAFATFDVMLTSAIQSPAMALYLDNISSVGPNSRVGSKAKIGLNENLSREILELHTLGVDGGYTQDDVKALAAILSGWSFGKPGKSKTGAVFEFRKSRHEPGPKRLLGRNFAEEGAGEGEKALAMLGRHPSTARFIATKLARHFVADDPPEAAVERLSGVFLDTGGDLKQLALAVIGCEEAWSEYPSKIRTPLEFLIAVHRAGGLSLRQGQLLRAATDLGQIPYNAPSPAGWSDKAVAWLSPEGMVKRAGYAIAAARTMRAENWPDLLETTLGPFASAGLRSALGTTPQREALALIFASPEFQRR